MGRIAALCSCATALLLLLTRPAQADNMTLDFAPDTGTVGVLGDTKLVEVQPGATITFAVTAYADSAVSLRAFTLNFVESDWGDSELTLKNWTLSNSAWNFPLNTILNTSAEPPDTGVSYGAILGGVSAEADVAVGLGTFQVIAPTTPGDYLLTGHKIEGTDGTRFEEYGTGRLINIEDFGEVTVRSLPEPSALTLLIGAAIALPCIGTLRRRRRWVAG